MSDTERLRELVRLIDDAKQLRQEYRQLGRQIDALAAAIRERALRDAYTVMTGAPQDVFGL